jgi:AraC-like DNA-binding protein
MVLKFEGWPTDSRLVESIWYTRSEKESAFTSFASSHCELVITSYQGQTSITLRGPETKATPALCPPDTEFFGIQLKLGAFMPHLPTSVLIDRQDLTLPEAGMNKFWLNSEAWELPTLENTDVFIHRLVRSGLLGYDPIVDAALYGQQNDLSLRSLQRRFLRATGLKHITVRQIERARQALALLQEGTPILDTVYMLGYTDQPHMTRSLKHFIGQTPAQIIAKPTLEPITFLPLPVPV